MKAVANSIAVIGEAFLKVITPDPERVKNLKPTDYFKSGFIFGMFVESAVILLLILYASR